MKPGQIIKRVLVILLLLPVALVLLVVLLVGAFVGYEQWLVWRLRQPVEFQVVDEAGQPVAGTEVSAMYFAPEEASGPVCLTDPLGRARAGADGRVHFRGLDVDHQPIRSRWQVWLKVEVPGTPPVVRRWRGGPVVTGGLRDVEGRVELPPDCPPGGLEAVASPPLPFNGWCGYEGLAERIPPVRVPLAPDGRFRLAGLRQQEYTVELNACGLELKRELAPQAREIELEAPAEGSPPRRTGRPRPAVPAQAGACLPFDRPPDLVAAVAGDQVQVSPGCGAVAVVGTKGAVWSLVEPGGAVSPLGECFEVMLGEAGAVACRRANDVNDSHGSLWVARKGAPPLCLVPDGYGSGQWSPRGRWLVFFRGSRLAAYDRSADRVVELGATGQYVFVADERILALNDSDLVRIDLGHGHEGEPIRVQRGVYHVQALPGTGRALVTGGSGDEMIVDAEGTRVITLPRDTSARAVVGELAILHIGKVGNSPSVMTALDLASGERRTLARGTDWVRARGGIAAVIENRTGRVIAIPLDSGPARFLGIESPGGSTGELSSDGRWFGLFNARFTWLARTDGGARRELPPAQGAWAPDAPVYYWKSGSDLRAVLVDEDRDVLAASRVTAFAPLAGGRFLAVHPAGPGGAPGALELQRLP